ncbi:uncharacterized protein K452DRAFT_293421 [Aplosporella prunicola CBS 121167]|uniref:Uncharacterized protein n=1 Tax=Aplosporella prunicola CBS 121167 TaxID=1176127 RepID=A0A6A6AW37_9PEZI|nr:uncharacterized protein K452DRAFT_293421 [Aplosporella prunicola CBS 121167]KAF2135185.1 hypothetical protein K452DRAFT_293421 [Aplosporella prunicola CBS 121167]
MTVWLTQESCAGILDARGCPGIIRKYAAEDDASLGFAICGPAGKLYDVRSAAANLQKDVLGKRPQEIYLHSEYLS